MAQPDEMGPSSQRHASNAAEPDQQRQSGRNMMATVMERAFRVIPTMIREPLTRAGAALRDTFIRVSSN